MNLGDLDPLREWKRLAELYGSMSDDELLRIAADRKDLTTLASEVLNAEMKNRALAEPTEEPSEVDPDAADAPADRIDVADAPLDVPDDMVEVGQFRFPSEGALAKAALESAGIETWVFDGTMAKYVGVGVRLAVKPEDVEAAEAILSQPIPESFEVEGVGTFEQPRCPQCNSFAISYGTAIYDGIMDRELLPDQQWWCQACGARWEDEEEESATTDDRPENPQP